MAASFREQRHQRGMGRQKQGQARTRWAVRHQLRIEQGERESGGAKRGGVFVAVRKYSRICLILRELLCPCGYQSGVGQYY